MISVQNNIVKLAKKEIPREKQLTFTSSVVESVGVILSALKLLPFSPHYISLLYVLIEELIAGVLSDQTF